MRRIIAGAVVVAVVALGTILVLGVFHRVQLGRVDKTIRIARGNAMVFEHYRTQKGTFPRAGYIGSAEGLVDMLSEYGELFSPNDGWGQPFLYQNSQDGNNYSLLSFGSNSEVEYMGEPYAPYYSGEPQHVVDTLVRNGLWHSWDQGQAPEMRIVPDQPFLDRVKQLKSQRASGIDKDGRH